MINTAVSLPLAFSVSQSAITPLGHLFPDLSCSNLTNSLHVCGAPIRLSVDEPAEDELQRACDPLHEGARLPCPPRFLLYNPRFSFCPEFPFLAYPLEELLWAELHPPKNEC